MSLFSNRPWALFQPSSLLLVTGLVGSVILGVGCSKRPAAAAIPTESVAASQALENNGVSSVTPRAPAAPAAVSDSVDEAAKLAQLTQVVRRFGAEQRRVPQSLGEVVTAGYLATVPAAPAGKRFAIDPKRMQVVIANK